MEITINYYGQAVSVSVEVYEYLIQVDHKAENLAHEQRRHWDGREFDEYIISTEGRLPYCATPEELVCQQETLDEKGKQSRRQWLLILSLKRSLLIIPSVMRKSSNVFTVYDEPKIIPNYSA